MAPIDTMANDKSLQTLLTDYLTCTIYLEQAQCGALKSSTGVQAAVSARLGQITEKALKVVRRQNYAKHPTNDTVHRAAMHILNQHPAGSAYFLNRLAVR